MKQTNSIVFTLIIILLITESAFAQLPVDENGWTIVEPSIDSKIIYVSSSQGNIGNNGLSPETPVLTIENAKQLVRAGYPDHILLKRGDTWILDKGLGSFFSGRSATEPMIISYYGDEGARPLIKTESHLMYVRDTICSNIALIGIELYAYKHDPNSPDYESESKVAGISYIKARGQNLLIEDCKFNYMQMGAYTTNKGGEGDLKNFKFRRNIIIHAWAGESYYIHELRTRIQGLYLTGVDGILVEENLFDHNGWDEQIDGAGSTMYNHNIYMSTRNPNPDNIIVRGNILARASAHGLQLRSGGLVEDNLFVQNAINLNVGYHANTPMSGAKAVVRNNVFQEVRLMDSLNTEYPRTAATRGIGEITIPTVIENNLFSHCINEAQVGIDTYNRKWKLGGSLEKKNNIIYKWTDKNDIPNPKWPHPERRIASYHQTLGKDSSTVGFLLNARERPLKTWWNEYSARAVNEYIRKGFVIDDKNND
ncbi:right-handed parallel beta-helix repeat-containing protein [Bacteroidota bacterium]